MPLTNHPSTTSPPRRVIVIGAGVAGLSCAHELLKSSVPLQVIVLEARNRVGGRVLTHWLNIQAPDSNLIPNYGPDAHYIQPQSPIIHQNTISKSPHTNIDNQHTQHRPRAVPILPATLLNSDGSRSPRLKDQSHATSPFPNTSKAITSPYRHDFSNIVTGKTIPQRLSQNGIPNLAVDIGASILHGCSDDHQLVFKRAVRAGIRAPIVAGGAFYESTEHAVWYDDTTGNRIPTETIVEIHNIFYMASRYMAAVASQSDDGSAEMQCVFDNGVEYVCQKLNNRKLTSLEQAILRKICARSVGYCLPMSEMALMQASAGMEATSADAHIGIPHEEDDPPLPGEIPIMLPGTIRQHASRLDRTIIGTQRSQIHTIASRRGGGGDRIVLDGYAPFLIDKLALGLDVRLGQSVCGISKALRAPDTQHGTPVVLDEAGRPMRTRSQQKQGLQKSTKWQSDPETLTRTVVVSTRNGEVYQSDFVVVTVPIGVLKEEHEESSITFFPPLSEEKQEAIQYMGMGIHNKILLRFHEDDIFWPPKVPQINCIDPRFQFFNLHSYGKTGVLLVHIFAESGFAKNFWGLSDEGILSEVLLVLCGMFFSSSDDSANEDTNSARNSKSKENDSIELRRRIARLLDICEKCKKPFAKSEQNQKNGNDQKLKVCAECGFEVKEADPPSKSNNSPPTTRFREREKQAKRAPNVNGQPVSELNVIVSGPREVTWENFPVPEEYVVTRWDADPFAFGSYSCMPRGSNWHMIEQIATPEPKDAICPYLFFAGEHCSDVGWQCVHGAHETGIRAAHEIISSLGGDQDANANLDTSLMPQTTAQPKEQSISQQAVQPTSQPEIQHVPNPVSKSTSQSVPQSTSQPTAQSTAQLTSQSTSQPVSQSTSQPTSQPVPQQEIQPVLVPSSPAQISRESFWTTERDRALTRALIGYSDVYGNMSDVIDEIAHAIHSFKKEPTAFSREELRDIVYRRIVERSEVNDIEATTFIKFHSDLSSGNREENFLKPFDEIHKRPRLIGLNGSKLRELYAKDIVQDLKDYAQLVRDNQISYRETLRKIAVKIYKRDGGLMTKRCLSEYLRTQEFGTGPQKELYLEKYLPDK